MLNVLSLGVSLQVLQWRTGLVWLVLGLLALQ